MRSPASQTSLSAAQGKHAKRITTWPLGIKESDDVCVSYWPQNK